MSTTELLEALNGPKGSLDCYLEARSDVEIRADILALIGASNTKREEFAKAAMQGLQAQYTNQDGYDPDNLARHAVIQADALILELAKVTK